MNYVFEDLDSLDNLSGAPDLDKLSWNNESREVVSDYQCYIPRKIIHILQSANQVLPNDEFSFLFKSRIDTARKMIIVSADEWFFPKQEVSAASILYEEDNTEFNTVIHKHPKGCTAFSQTDKDYINANFKISILWVDDRFAMGIVNFESEVGVVQLPLKFYIEREFAFDEEIQKLVKEKAHKKVFAAAATKSGLGLFHHGTWQSGVSPAGAKALADEEFEEYMSNKWWR